MADAGTLRGLMRERPPSTRVRVLHVVWRLSPRGGEGALVRAVLRSLDEGEFDVHVCSIRPPTADDELDALGSGVQRHHLGFAGGLSLRDRLRVLQAVARVVRALDPDVLHVHSGTAWYSIPASVRMRTSAKLLEIQDSPASRRISAANHRVQRFMVRRLGFRVLTHSREVQEGVERTYGLPAGSTSRFPLGIDAPTGAERDRQELRARAGISPDDVVVLYVARLVPSKRPDEFVEIAARVVEARPHPRFVLVGSGPLADELAERARAAGLTDRIWILGHVPRLDVWYRAADVFLSTSEYEGFGLAVADALAYGLPVVATGVGGIPDVVEGGGAVLVAAGDVDAATAAVLRLADDPAARRHLGAEGAEWARRGLRKADMLAAYRALYLAMADRRPTVGQGGSG